MIYDYIAVMVYYKAVVFDTPLTIANSNYEDLPERG